MDEFKFSLDVPMTLTISATVQRPGTYASSGVSFYLNKGGERPLVLYSSFSNPTTEPRFTIHLQPGTYVFHAEARDEITALFADSGGAAGLNYRVDTVPEPTLPSLLALALPFATRRSRRIA